MKIKEVNYEKASRKDFAKVGDYIEMPNLIKVQRDSYDWFVEDVYKRQVHIFHQNLLEEKEMIVVM